MLQGKNSNCFMMLRLNIGQIFCEFLRESMEYKTLNLGILWRDTGIHVCPNNKANSVAQSQLASKLPGKF